MGASGGRPAKPPGIGEYLFNELRRGFHDIRQRVVEEGWFGRVTTPKPVIEVGHQPEEAISPARRENAPEYRPSFDELYRSRERSPEPADRERDHSLER